MMMENTKLENVLAPQNAALVQQGGFSQQRQPIQQPTEQQPGYGLYN